MSLKIVKRLETLEAAWLQNGFAPDADAIRPLISALLQIDGVSSYLLARAHLLLGASYATARRPSFDQALRFFGGLTDFKLEGSYLQWFVDNTGSDEEKLLRGRMRFNYVLVALLGRRLLNTQSLVAASEMAVERLLQFPEQRARAELLRAYICRSQRRSEEAARHATTINTDLLSPSMKRLCDSIRYLNASTRDVHQFAVTDLL